MTLLSVPELKAEMIRLGNLIGATDSDLPTFGVYEENNKYGYTLLSTEKASIGLVYA